MKKTGLFCIVLIFMLLSAYFVGILLDKNTLRHDLIRLHVVANSDSTNDQINKLAVRDAVTEYLQKDIVSLQCKEAAMVHIQNNLATLEEIAANALMELGCTDSVKVTLTAEEFTRRDYDTFSLPAGIYDSLRIQIGDASGKNWWCVVFPSFCLPASGLGFADVAAASGFNERLTNTLYRQEKLELRFFVLDCLGMLENFLH